MPDKLLKSVKKNVENSIPYKIGKMQVDLVKSMYDKGKNALNYTTELVKNNIKPSEETRYNLKKAELKSKYDKDETKIIKDYMLDAAKNDIKGTLSDNGEDVKTGIINQFKTNPISATKAAIKEGVAATKYGVGTAINEGMHKIGYGDLNKEQKTVLAAGGAAGLAGLAGLGYLGYRLLKKNKKEKKDMKKSFSEEFCENKALISAANTVDMITLIDPVNYSEYSAGLISKITSTPLDYVTNVMKEVSDFNAHFSEEKIDMFVDEISNIYENFNEGIIKNYSEYLNSLTDFDEASAEAKVNDLSDLISLMDEDTIKELGTDYVAGVIASATDTNVDLLKNTIEKYLASDEKTEVKVEKAEEKTEEAVKATEEAKDAVKEETKEFNENDVKVAQEKFSEVFIKKDGQYFKFNDAVVSIPVKE